MTTFLYPSAVAEANSISYAAQSAKIARHSPCSSCACEGLHPPPGWRAISDDSEDVGDVLDMVDGSEFLTDEGHLKFCDCGHPYGDHGCDPTLDREEHSRRARVAVRIDELLEEKEKFLDFEYIDDDVRSLRRQMRFPRENSSSMDISMEYEDPTGSVGYNGSDRASSSGLSDAPMSITGNKRPRSMSSSLSDDDMEEDKPLASRPAPSLSSAYGRMGSQGDISVDIDMDGDGDADAEGDIDADAEAEDDPDDISTTVFQDPQRSGKSNTTLGHMSLANQAPHGSNGHVNSAMAAAEAKAKANVLRTVGRADEGQKVARLATGIAIDAGVASNEAPLRRERPAALEEQAGIIKFEVVNNDGSPRSSILLTGLKCLFQKQLPKMPREYITRLVFDRNAQAMAIVQRGHKVVGGITYRPFPHRTFAEIVFFAIASAYQVNGYGGHLMNHFKAHVRKNIPSIMHFLAYADNYAIGYFKKQGFTRDITLPRELWVGYIKDYEGGTLMQCAMLPNVDYLRARETLLEQKEAIMGKIRQLSRSHIVHSGLSVFRNSPPGFRIDPKDVPGLRESGWTPEMDAILRRPTRGADHMSMKKLLSELQGHADAWPFLLPVNKAEVTDYYDVIKSPMDFSTMERKLENDAYPDFDSFVSDAQLVFSNCRTYNPENSPYSKRAVRMEKFLKDYLAKAQKT